MTDTSGSSDFELNDDRMPREAATVSLALDRFLDSLDAIDEMLDVLGPEVAQLDTFERAYAVFDDSLRDMPARWRTPLADAFREYTTEVEASGTPGLFDLGDALEFAEKKLGYHPWMDEMWYGLQTARTRSRRETLLRRGLLTLMVGAFEVLIGEVVAYFYTKHPSAVSGPDKEFSLSDLQQLSSLTEARDLAIARRVDAFLFESFRSWSRWFEKNLGFGFSEICVDWEQLQEVIERRHIIVHNGGRVSRRYLQNIGDALADVRLGTTPAVDDKYLQDALLQFRVVGVLASALSMIKLDRDWAEFAVGHVQGTVYRFLLSGDWQAVKALTEAGLKLRVSHDDKLVFQMNNWLARARLGENIHAEVSDLDDSALAGKFRLGRAALLGQTDEALTMLETCLEQKDVGLEALVEWPVLDGVRQDSRFREILNGHYDQLVEREGRRRRLTEVVVAPSGETFHLSSCRFARGATRGMPRRTAEVMGLRQCRTCCRPTSGGGVDAQAERRSDGDGGAGDDD